MIRLSNVTFVAILQPTSVSSFNPTACSVVVTGGFTSGSDSFECYTPATDFSDPLNGGSGWAATGRIAAGYNGQQAIDTFESYNTGAITTLSAGNGWSGAWVIS